MCKLTRKQLSLIAVYSGIMSNGIQFTVLFPYASDLVRTFGGTEDRSSTGTWVGILASSIMLARAAGSPIFGVICDRWGRKPVLCLGLMAGVICPILFGLSTNLYWALAIRTLQGLLSPLALVVKTILSELCPGPEQAKAIAVMTLCFQCSFVLGTVLGGLLVHPNDSGIIQIGLFDTYPFLLPNIIPSIICLVSLILVITCLPETLKKDSLLNEDSRNLWKIAKDTDVVITQVIYFIICGMDAAVFEVFNLWLYAKKEDGGFALNPNSIGLILGLSALGMTIIQKLYLDFMFTRYNLLRVCNGHWVIRIVVYALLPLAAVVRYHDLLAQVVLVGCYLVVNVVGIPSLTLSLVFSNNSVISKERGRLNGISMTFGSLARGITPLVFGYIFASTTGSGLIFPLNYGASFEILAVLGILSTGVFFKLPETIVSSKDELLADHEIELVNAADDLKEGRN